MRLVYEVEDVGRLELERAYRPRTVNVQSLVVDQAYQGLGVGRALMRCACRDADRDSVELWLVPQSIDGRQQELENFYSKMGFVKYHGSGYMIRKPREYVDPFA